MRTAFRTSTQLGLLERFDQTLKSEKVHCRLFNSPGHARTCLDEFRQRYYRAAPRWALVPVDGGDAVTPKEAYDDGVAVGLPRWLKWAIAVRDMLRKITEGQHFPVGDQLEDQ